MDSSHEELLERIEARRLPTLRERRRIRKDAGLTQGEVADALGVEPITISRWERGKARPRGEQARRYRELLEALEERAS